MRTCILHISKYGERNFNLLIYSLLLKINKVLNDGIIENEADCEKNNYYVAW